MIDIIIIQIQMLPLYKLLSLFLRVFSRPLINLTKKHHAAHGIKNQFIKKIFFMMGNKYHQFEMFINRRYLKSDSKNPARELSQPLAIDKGIQFFYQIIFYTIAIGFPTYQLIRAAKDTKSKEQKLKNRVETLKKNIELIAANKKKIQATTKENHHLLLVSFQLITDHFIITNPFRYKVLPHTLIQNQKQQTKSQNGSWFIMGKPMQNLIDFIV